MTAEPHDAHVDEPATRSHGAASGPAFTPVPGHSPPPFIAPKKERLQTSEIIRRSVLGMTLGVMAIAILVFLSAINAVIEVWLVYQWVPIARAVVALLVVALCVLVLFRLTGLRK